MREPGYVEGENIILESRNAVFSLRLKSAKGLKLLELVDSDPQGTSGSDQSAIIAGESYGLPLFSEKVHRRYMKRIESPDRPRKRFQGPREDRRGELNKGDTAQESTHLVSVRSGEFARVNASPDFILKQTARDQILPPKPLRWHLVFCKEMSEGDRGVEIDQRSLRSCSSSRRRELKDMTGFRGGGPAGDRAGGVIQPLRTASASNASARSGLRFFWAGASSATTRSRSVTNTVSPLSARRTYSLSLFLRTFSPTARIGGKVASGSYHVKSWAAGFQIGGNAAGGREIAARAFGMKLQCLDVLTPKDIEPAFRVAIKGRAEAS